jgi:hypothetical protein
MLNVFLGKLSYIRELDARGSIAWFGIGGMVWLCIRCQQPASKQQAASSKQQAAMLFA